MPPGRRLAALLVVLALVAVPPVVLRVLCAGKTCEDASSGSTRVPFCPLPAQVKALIVAGYYSGRSPDVLGVTATTSLQGGSDPEAAGALWPGASPLPDTRVPVVLFGDGVDPDVTLPDGMRLDRIAPSLADVLGFERDHPEVRAGTAVPGVASGAAPRLVLEIVWRGVGTADLESSPGQWSYLRDLIRTASASTLEGDAGSVPLDPAATLTTIGTGGPPSQHGITGSFVRNDQDQGEVTRVWGPGAPTSVLSTLPDDLDAPGLLGRFDQAPLIGLVATDSSDRGLIGGDWYLGHDRDDVRIANDPLPVVHDLLEGGYGADEIPDVLAVVLNGSIATMDARTRAIVEAADAAGTATVFVVTATGTTMPGAASAESVMQQVDAAAETSRPMVEASVPGGLFLDQGVLEEGGLTSNVAVQAMLDMRTPSGGEKLFADAFPGFAVSFARYC